MTYESRLRSRRTLRVVLLLAVVVPMLVVAPRFFLKADAASITFEAEAGAISGPFTVVDGALVQPSPVEDPSQGGRASFVFDITAPGEYGVTAVVSAPNDDADSLFVNIDAEPDASMIWDLPLTNGFEERTAGWRGNGTPETSQFPSKVWSLGVGTHELVLRGREANALIDRVAIVPINVAEPTPVPAPPTEAPAPPTQPPAAPEAAPGSPAPVPAGEQVVPPTAAPAEAAPSAPAEGAIAGAPPASEPQPAAQVVAAGTSVVFEAESGQITSPFTVKNGAVSQSIDAGLNGGGGRAVYTFDLAAAGSYVVNVVAYAPDGYSNSLHANIDGAIQVPQMIWDLPVTSGFKEQPVTWRNDESIGVSQRPAQVFNLAAGRHTLTIVGREKNTQFDRIAIVPVGTSAPSQPAPSPTAAPVAPTAAPVAPTAAPVAPTAAPVTSGTTSGVIARINAGGSAVTTSGVNWGADQYAINGNAYRSNVGIGGTNDVVLYQSERIAGTEKGSFSYAIPVPAGGTYTVRLHFAEIYWTSAGKRVFSVNLEGGSVELPNYDIVAEVGPKNATIKQYAVQVSDGTLNIDFTASVNQPKVSAIEVVSGSSGLVSQPAPTAAPATPAPTAQPSSGTVLSGPPPASGKRFSILAPGSTLPSEGECAQRIRRTTWEPRASNKTPNNRKAVKGSDFKLEAFTGNNQGIYVGDNPKKAQAINDRVTGQFTGTTDEILQFYACKWGFDEDWARAQAHKETTWNQAFVGDNGNSFGILQIKQIYFKVTTPGSSVSTPFAVDYTFSRWRLCYEGYIDYLGENGTGYKAGDAWGCMGWWYSGKWRNSSGLEYIQQVKDRLYSRPWEATNFRFP